MSWVMTSQVILDLPLEPFIYSLRMLFQNYVDEARPVSTYEKVFSCNKRCYKSYCNVLCCKGTKECTCTGCWHLLSGESFLKLYWRKVILIDVIKIQTALSRKGEVAISNVSQIVEAHSCVLYHIIQEFVWGTTFCGPQVLRRFFMEELHSSWN